MVTENASKAPIYEMGESESICQVCDLDALTMAICKVPLGQGCIYTGQRLP